MIIKKNGKYIIMSEDGLKQLGEFKTKEEAAKRLRQIEYFKNKSKVSK